MRIVEYSDYIYGKKFLAKMNKPVFRGDASVLERGYNLLERFITAKSNLKFCDSAKLFYKCEPDMANAVPTKERDEIFYSLKIGCISPIIPAKALFLLKKCWDENGTMNVLSRVIPKGDLDDMLSEGYIGGGFSLYDCICSFVTTDFKPVSQVELAVSNGDNFDVYIDSVDSVAIVPPKLKNLLSHEDILELEVKSRDIVLHGKPIRTMGGFIGAVNSTYDLSRLI